MTLNVSAFFIQMRYSRKIIDVLDNADDGSAHVSQSATTVARFTQTLVPHS